MNKKKYRVKLQGIEEKLRENMSELECLKKDLNASKEIEMAWRKITSALIYVQYELRKW